MENAKESKREKELTETDDERKVNKKINKQLDNVLDGLLEFESFEAESNTENKANHIDIQDKHNKSDFRLFKTSINRPNYEIEEVNKRKRRIVESSSDSSDEDERVSSVVVNAEDIMKYASQMHP